MQADTIVDKNYSLFETHFVVMPSAQKKSFNRIELEFRTGHARYAIYSKTVNLDRAPRRFLTTHLYHYCFMVLSLSVSLYYLLTGKKIKS